MVCWSFLWKIMSNMLPSGSQDRKTFKLITKRLYTILLVVTKQLQTMTSLTNAITNSQSLCPEYLEDPRREPFLGEEGGVVASMFSTFFKRCRLRLVFAVSIIPSVKAIKFPWLMWPASIGSSVRRCNARRKSPPPLTTSWIKSDAISVFSRALGSSRESSSSNASSRRSPANSKKWMRLKETWRELDFVGEIYHHSPVSAARC